MRYDIEYTGSEFIVSFYIEHNDIVYVTDDIIVSMTKEQVKKIEEVDDSDIDKKVSEIAFYKFMKKLDTLILS